MIKTKTSVRRGDEVKKVNLTQYEDINEAIKWLGAERAKKMINRQYKIDQLNRARELWDKLPPLEITEKIGISGSLISTLMRAIALLIQEKANIHLHDFVFDPIEEELIVTIWRDGADEVVITVPY